MKGIVLRTAAAVDREGGYAAGPIAISMPVESEESDRARRAHAEASMDQDMTTIALSEGGISTSAHISEAGGTERPSIGHLAKTPASRLWSKIRLLFVHIKREAIGMSL